MILKRFYIVVLISIIVIVLTAVLFALALVHLNHLFTIIITGALLILEAAWLIAYINRINATLERFFLAVKNDDSSITYSQSGHYQVYKDLTALLDEIMHAISRVKIEKEHQFQYLRYVMEHVDAGLLAYGEDGKIELINRSATRLFNNFQPGSLGQMDRIRPGFEKELRELQPGQRKLLTIKSDSDVLQLAIRSSRFKLDEKEVNLVSFQDIHHELDQKELSSWRKLIRVLRHEIMNTVSPIASLATTLSRIYGTNKKPKNKKELSDQNVQDTIEGLDIIRTRSRGLLNFVEQYRKLTKLPDPEFENLEVAGLLQDIVVLFHGSEKIGELAATCPPDLRIRADRKLIEQVLINLVKNAAESTAGMENPEIELRAIRSVNGRVCIQVKDNGPGIPQDVLPNIFVPFYSTREKGSGIGLSISRQIMDLHQGKITVHSVPAEETVFSLIF